jgi:putative tricarboxylic transport membrane protein
MTYGTQRCLALGWVILLAASLSGCRGGREAGRDNRTEYPAKAISIMAPAAPGGGWDQMARAMQTALADSVGRNVQVYNAPGAGGTIGLAQFVNDHAGDAHQLMVGGLVMVGATETNRSPVTLDQVTPIATLTAEWEAIVVSADSPYKTFQQLLDAFKAEPASISWSGGSAGGVDHMLIALIARAAGVAPSKINYVAHSGGGEAMAALLSGAATAGVASVSEFRDQVEAGKLRWLAVSSDRPIPGVGATTIKDAGLEVVAPNWRAVFAPPRITEAERIEIIRAMEKMRATPEWRQALARNGWDDFFKTGDEFAGFLRQEQGRVKTVLLSVQCPECDAGIGPRFFPLIVAVGLTALGALWLLRLRVRPDAVLTAHIAEEAAATHWPTVGLTAAALLVYAFALGSLGYIAATALFFPFVARVLGSRRIVRDALIGLALAVVIYFSFTRLLGVRLPAGLLDFTL